jgi:hypothetical protein
MLVRGCVLAMLRIALTQTRLEPWRWPTEHPPYRAVPYNTVFILTSL